ncbi:hypothetical protein FC75_GL001588 [Lacticaseibacillus camelliae DSM 22697 = JCM 13995]|uniref:N-acetyltransferase domain-containing protein n=2 Tax=Lacticaseibacillus camelliae TaxID=381742 RepID=A0A0R2F5G0_9LACO|nr:hypothetical protein FC75_GL001588 [Lacticaseibacillus camelliae DSM 22697 = JCM 13995]
MIRPATQADFAAIMAIIGDAKALLKRQGIPQWQAAYPASADIQQDLQAGTGRVLVVAGTAVAYASLETAPEPVYEQIQQGHWHCGGPYSTIHRVAMAAAFQGRHLSVPFMQGLIAEAERTYPNVRVDTQTENRTMQHILAQLGFKQRGLVRWTFEVPVVTCFAYELNLAE